jgi:hypothetical protein
MLYNLLQRFTLRKTIHFKTHILILNHLITNRKLRQAEKYTIHQLFKIFPSNKKNRVRSPIIFLLTPKITAMQTLITISKMP